MYRILKDPQTGEDYIKRFEFEQGFIGFVNSSGQTVQCQNLQKDYRFIREIDDPNYVQGQSVAKEVICCPIYASDDFAMAAKEQMASYPRCVLMLINKVPDSQIMHKIRLLGEHSAQLLKQSCKFEA